ncbi:MAG: DNA polymerase I [Spirochaetales bacterium]|nr:DNA polymerase I [Spirochaetales bacterium]
MKEQKEKAKTEPVYLIDGYSLIYRAYYAFLKNPLRNPAGKNASAIYGFILSLNKLIRLKNPRFLCVVMDSITPTFRHKEYSRYKANRENPPEDLHPQIPRLEEILKAQGIPCLRENGFEADDIIATIAVKCREEKRPCFILTKDKDLLQLVDEQIKILYPEKGLEDFSVCGKDEVYEKKGIYPEQVVDFLSLSGDTSDNIPGVSGIGEKTAAKLLAQFKTLDRIYQDIDNITSKSQKQKLIDGKESASLSRKLVTLRTDTSFKGFDSIERILPDYEKLIFLYKNEGFQSFLKDLEKEGLYRASLPQTKEGTYKTLTRLEEIDEWISLVKKEKVFAFDVETTHKDVMLATPIGFSLSTGKGKACYIPIQAHDCKCPAEGEIRKRLISLLTDSSLRLVGQNIKYDYKVMKRWGIKITNIFFDTMIAAWLLDSASGRYNMDYLAEKYLKFKTIHYKELILKGEEKTLFDIDIQHVTDYAAEDADITYQLYELFEKKLDEEKSLKDLFYSVEMPLVTVLSDMELTGIKLEAETLKTYGNELECELENIEKKIYKDCGHEFNIRSTKELQQILFEERGLKPLKKTKTGYSTDSNVLEQLAQEDVVADKVVKHRFLSKLKSTYTDTLPGQINPATGRIHTHFLQTGTATGRLSSNEPNLQNIPVREEEGRRIRSAFIAEKGHILLSADYSQIELVILAHLSGDEKLIQAFNQGKDIHTHTASLIFSREEPGVTPPERRIGKTINFGVIYGMSAFRLSKDLKISRTDADRFIDAYFNEYSGVARFKEQIIENAEKTGYVETILGRKRAVPNIKNPNKTVRMAEQRIAVNTPIQGSASDIVKTAMIRVKKELADAGSKTQLILQVHDELIFEVPEDETGKVEKIIKQAMENAIKLKVPLVVSIEKARTWGEIH